ncbi:MAG: DUF3307 domain-containing protein [Bacteroidota bacterium]|nr:DUF3307 domain-containing protein [Bacteroidota bacterium]
MLTAHFLSDFVLQPTVMAQKKNELGIRSPYLYLHISTTLLVLCLLLLLWQWWLWPVVLIITISHLIIDALKSLLTKTQWLKNRLDTWDLWIFLADQLLHLIIILFLWISFTGQFQIFIEKISIAFHNMKIWWLLLAYITLSFPSSVLISKITRRWSNQVENTDNQEFKGLLYAGKWIGIFERLLIFTFVMIGEFSGVGFLLAAKSVFRFGDLKNSSAHMKTEYIILGTLLSFSIAIFTGLIVKHYYILS